LEDSETKRQRVILAKEIQQKRFKKDSIYGNAQMKNSHIKKYCRLSKETEQLLKQASLKFQLSARSYMKMIKVSRTIADLAGEKNISVAHMAEALQYRPKIYEA
jgi:magnesium chelatase family protein